MAGGRGRCQPSRPGTGRSHFVRTFNASSNFTMSRSTSEVDNESFNVWRSGESRKASEVVVDTYQPVGMKMLKINDELVKPTGVTSEY